MAASTPTPTAAAADDLDRLHDLRQPAVERWHPRSRSRTTTSGVLGTISTYATTLGNTHDASVFPGGISHAATPGGVISRQPVDDRYNQ
ncbi:MAG: hypothetical protein R2695_06115 [Acidimicrobiales bacterium]